MLVDVSQDVLINDAELTPLRNQLVQRAVHYYEGFLKQRAHDPAFKQRIAEARVRLGEVFELLDRRNESLRILRDAEREVAGWTSQDRAAQALIAQDKFADCKSIAEIR